MGSRGFNMNFMTNMQKLNRGIWPWTRGLKSRLPLHYKIRYTENWMKTPEPVHYKADLRKFVPDEKGNPIRFHNIPIPLTLPFEADHGLWGGEGMIAGLRKKKNLEYKPRHPRLWKPFLTKRVLYSEILDTYYDLTVTLRTLDLIDQNYGFDFYILKTHEVDLKSKLGMTLKREMLMTLAKKSFYPNNPDKREEVFEKYKEFLIPLEEAEWIGLSLQEAERKQHSIEETLRKKEEIPLKISYAENLLHRVKQMETKKKGEGEGGRFKKSVVQNKSWLNKLIFKD